MYNIYSSFDFGQYKGISIWVVAASHPSYIEWCVMNVEWFSINNMEALDLIPIIHDYQETPEVLELRERLKEKVGQNPNLFISKTSNQSITEYLEEKGISFYLEHFKPFLSTYHKYSREIIDINTKRVRKENSRRNSIESNQSRNESSFDKYNGAYGFDDETIDNAFEGDPENYWNIE